MWQMRNPPSMHRELSDIYRDTLEEVVAAESLGIESAWISEHHFCDDQYLPSVFPMLGAMAARTSTIRLGTYVMLAPFYDPIRLAEDVAVVDTLSAGRLELAMGSGYRLEEFVGLGVDKTTRGRRLNDIVAIVQQAWSDHPVHFRSELYFYDDVSVTPKPVQRPVPLFLGGVSRPMLERVAKFGVAGVAGVPKEEDVAYLNERLIAYDRDPAGIQYLSHHWIWVDRDGERAKRVGRENARYVLGRYRDWTSNADELSVKDRGVGESLRGTDLSDEELDRQCIMGTPAYCVERLGDVLQQGAHAGISRLILAPPLLGVDHAESMRLIETLAHDVLPHFYLD